MLSVCASLVAAAIYEHFPARRLLMSARSIVLPSDDGKDAESPGEAAHRTTGSIDTKPHALPPELSRQTGPSNQRDLPSVADKRRPSQSRTRPDASDGLMVIDPSRGLMWQDDGYEDTAVDGVRYWSSTPNGKLREWQGAMEYCNDLTLGGYSDWRLPSLEELRGAYGIRHKFRHVKPNRYWTATLKTLNLHWYVLFSNGKEDYNYAPWYTLYVRCVRDVAQA